jgi:ERCC4-type nuclease
MLHCIEDARYNEQRRRMREQYDVSVLILEGHWKPHNENGMMMEGFHNGINYGYCRPGGRRIMYSKLSRYLISVQLAGVIVDRTRDIGHTAFDIVDWFHYFQKPWEGHTSLLEMQKVAIPTLNAKPSLVRKWAFALDGVGTKTSEDIAKHFRYPLKLANASEQDFLKIPGIGVKTAQSIVKQIWGGK